jgi:hypothetical protein
MPTITKQTDSHLELKIGSLTPVSSHNFMSYFRAKLLSDGAF